VKIDVLGPFSVSYGKFSAVPAAQKPRTILAILAMCANEVVSVDKFTWELWASSPPATARASIQTYIMNVRKLMTHAQSLCQEISEVTAHNCAKETLVRTVDGYMLKVTNEQIHDMWEFRRLAEVGYIARSRGELEFSSRKFAEALSLWHGDALCDVRLGPQLTAEVARLHENRLNVFDCRIDVDLRLGKHHQVLGDLVSLRIKYQSHEGLAAHHMFALYRVGRRSEALDVYRQLHSTLANNYGLEPSPLLQRLQRTMLTSGHDTTELTDVWRSASSRIDTTRSSLGRKIEVARRPNRIPADIAAISWKADKGPAPT
jgi:SARP family transcriptional regulator, regulator of embCAB operon